MWHLINKITSNNAFEGIDESNLRKKATCQFNMNKRKTSLDWGSDRKGKFSAPKLDAWEIELGEILGTGSFCTVFELENVKSGKGLSHRKKDFK
jgi:hypothetical protein